MLGSWLAPICFILTVVLYFITKWLYSKRRSILVMPLLLAPLLILAVLFAFHIPYHTYIRDSHWLLWMLGPATVAFAVPVYDQRQLIRRHWLSLSVGVTVSVIVAVGSSVMIARLFHLSDILQRSLAVRSITTPFAIEAAKSIGGKSDLTAIFVVITGVFGMAIGEFMMAIISIRSRLGLGAGFGASSHGAGTAKAYQIGNTEGAVSSVIMMLAGMITVCIAPFVGKILWS